MILTTERLALREFVEDDWRAVLASSHARLWRNLDKLVDDAQASELVNVSAFLEYLSVLREAGAREGEAPAAEGGALQLMTIHKSKGLEFDLVVLADAARVSPQRAQPAYLMEEVGVAAAMDRLEGESIAYRVARALDSEQSQAEEARLLYVAATRARERLIVNGHLSQARGSLSTAGWMEQILELLGLEPKALAGQAGKEEILSLPGGQHLRLWTASESDPQLRYQPGRSPAWPDSTDRPLYPVVPTTPREETDPDLDQEPERTWRATGSGPRAPAVAVGRIIHAAIQRSMMPGSPGYERFIENEAFRAGLVDVRHRRAAIEESSELLSRLAAHELWAEVSAAQVAQHEIPFTTSDGQGQVRSGKIDLLWRGPEGWKIVDFKTDTLRDEADLRAAVDWHRNQVERYVRCAAGLLGEKPLGLLCFLDAEGEMKLVEI